MLHASTFSKHVEIQLEYARMTSDGNPQKRCHAMTFRRFEHGAITRLLSDR
jgi:hypothetical protein